MRLTSSETELHRQTIAVHHDMNLCWSARHESDPPPLAQPLLIKSFTLELAPALKLSGLLRIRLVRNIHERRIQRHAQRCCELRLTACASWELRTRATRPRSSAGNLIRHFQGCAEADLLCKPF